MHDFALPELGKVSPDGIDDLAQNQGWVNVGIDHDTAAFAVASIRRWWSGAGRERYPGTARLLITARPTFGRRRGGSNGSRLRLWKWELQHLADETGLASTVCHYPPGTSKWNKIEHRLFACISQNWRGQPLVSYAVLLRLIAATTTTTGLTVESYLDATPYPAGVKVTDAQMDTLHLERHAFHGEWNYTLSPRPTPAIVVS